MSSGPPPGSLEFFDFLNRSGLSHAPSDVQAYLKTLFNEAEEGHRAKQALESMRQSELDIAAREAEENAFQIALIVRQTKHPPLSLSLSLSPSLDSVSPSPPHPVG